MNNMLRHTWVKISLLGALVLVCLYAVVAYVLSYHTLIFTFDTKLGYVELSQGSEQLYPVSNQPLKLKAGEYTVRAIGDNIDPRPKTITVKSSQTVPIKFSYTAAHLQSLYVAEKDDIAAALHAAYPRVSELYRVEQGRLYARGDIYGASLIAKDQSGDNADTLRVLLRKKNDTWQVASKPPAPLLSAPNYPDIPTEILRSINQVK